MTRPLRILMVASEATPWLKTGGLADAVAGLSDALHQLGHDVRLLLPAYADLRLPPAPIRSIAGTPLQVHAPADAAELWLARLPEFTERHGNPYHDEHGRDWPDNAGRFARFARLAVAMAGDRLGLDWQPDIVHCHDWQTGLVPVQMQLQRIDAASMFTIHNLAYRGLFPAHELPALQLPEWLWHPQALEFHGQLSLIKGGLVFADALTTVSPRYAGEISQPDHGHGLDGLLRHRSAQLHGVLNGIDDQAWNPATDPALPAHFDAGKLAGKSKCKAALQREMGLPVDPERPLLAVVSRLVPQKGIDLILQILPELLRQGCQLAVLGSGEAALQHQLAASMAAHPEAVAFQQGFDEALAHRIEAGADIFLMPSRFEPCGLNQLYSLRYGTPPVVHATGGLADSIIDATHRDGTGFVFTRPDSRALLDAVLRALELWQNRKAWRALQRRGMRQEHSWQHSGKKYLTLYQSLIEKRRTQPPAI